MSDSRSTPAAPDSKPAYFFHTAYGQIIALQIMLKEGGGILLTQPENISRYLENCPELAQIAQIIQLELQLELVQERQDEEMKQEADSQYETDSDYSAGEISSEYSHASADSFSGNASLRSSLESVSSISSNNSFRVMARQENIEKLAQLKAVKDQAAFDRNRMFSQQPKQQNQHQNQHCPIHQPMKFGR